MCSDKLLATGHIFSSVELLQHWVNCLRNICKRQEYNGSSFENKLNNTNNNSNKMSFHTTTEEIVLSCASNGYKEFSKYSCCRVLILAEWKGQAQSRILSYKC